ncbi:MAG: hypothetical protein WBA12_08655 [Catalinimonas sp.]
MWLRTTNLFIVLLLVGVGCTSPREREGDASEGADASVLINDPPPPTDYLPPVDESPGVLTFRPEREAAILVGENIMALDTALRARRDVSLREGQNVEVTGVSRGLYDTEADYCRAFRYVRIQTDGEEVIVSGRHVYTLTAGVADTTFIAGNTLFAVLRTEYYGIGADDKDGPTFCSAYREPVVIKNLNTNRYRLVPVAANRYSERATHGGTFAYLELWNNDRGRDEIAHVETSGTGVLLRVRRRMQEERLDYEVLLTPQNQKWTARYLSYPDATTAAGG